MKPEIETFQNEWELEQLVSIFEYHGPAKTLEVGCWDGGTLWHWLQTSDTVVAVDDRMRREDDWCDWADDAEAILVTVRGRSDDPRVIRDCEMEAPYDFLFIDADHSYDSVLKDWNNYSPMVREGGIVALHDILPRPGYGVSRLWEELTAFEGVRYATICHNAVMPGNEGRCGIGIIFL